MDMPTGGRDLSLTVTLKKAQRGIAVPCGIALGYLDRSKIVRNAKHWLGKETHSVALTLAQAAVNLDGVVKK